MGGISLFYIFSLGIDLLSIAVFLLPALLLLEARRLDRRRTPLLVLFALYLAVMLSVTGVPSVYHWTWDPAVNLIPFADIVNSPGSYLKNSALNCLLFLPLGFFLPLLWPEFRSGKRTFLLGLGVSLVIELLQLFSFRFTDIDDLILNTLGAVLGFLLARTLFRGWKGNPAPTPPRWELPAVIILVFLVMMLLQPLFSSALWEAILDSPLWARLRP